MKCIAFRCFLIFLIIFIAIFLVLSITVTKCKCEHDSDIERYLHYIVMDLGFKSTVSLLAGIGGAFLFYKRDHAPQSRRR